MTHSDANEKANWRIQHVYFTHYSLCKSFTSKFMLTLHNIQLSSTIVHTIIKPGVSFVCVSGFDDTVSETVSTLVLKSISIVHLC